MKPTQPANCSLVIFFARNSAEQRTRHGCRNAQSGQLPDRARRIGVVFIAGSDFKTSMFRDLGTLGLYVVVLMAAGVSLSLLTLVRLAAKKQGAVKKLGLICLLTAGCALALGALGYALGLVALTAALPNVPFDLTAELLRKGTVEARVSLFLAMIAAALPWLVGSIAMVLSRFRLGIGVAVIVTVGLISMLLVHEGPLPSGKVTLATVEGLRLPASTAQRRPGAQPLIALTPGALWVEGSKVASMALALDHPRVREQKSNVLPLMVDGRVSFSELVDLLEAAARSKHYEFDLVVQSKEDLAVIRVRNSASLAPEDPEAPSMRLTLRVTEENVEVIAVGGALDPLPVDWIKVQDKLMEVKAVFPHETILRITAAPEVSMDVLVKALDASRETAQRKLLFPDAVLGRFERPTTAAPVDISHPGPGTDSHPVGPNQ